MNKSAFVHLYLPLALSAGEAFGISPVVILAQAAIETGWGQSTLCLEHRNYFGLTAYGKPSPFWTGSKTDLSEDGGQPSLWFRVYASAAHSFMDFARLLHTAYPTAAALSFNPSAYAKEIAYSRYISEVNGDNRAAYQRMLVSICNYLEPLINR